MPTTAPIVVDFLGRVLVDDDDLLTVGGRDPIAELAAAFTTRGQDVAWVTAHFPDALGPWTAEGELHVNAGSPFCGDGCCGDLPSLMVGGDSWDTDPARDVLAQLRRRRGRVGHLVVTGGILDRHSDPRHPRYEVLEDVVLAHRWDGHPAGATVRVGASSAASMRRTGAAVTVPSPTWDSPEGRAERLNRLAAGLPDPCPSLTAPHPTREAGPA